MLRYVRFYNQAGLALITALIFLQIIAILGLYAVQSAIQAEKMSRLDWRQNINFMAAEQVLQLVESNLLRGIPDCVIPVIPQDEMIKKSLSWWQSPARCAGNFQLFQYYYVVEKLGIDACANIDQFNTSDYKNCAIAYFRITLLIIDKNIDTRELLQSTVVTPDNAVLSCTGDHHRLTLGRQMWRELR